MTTATTTVKTPDYSALLEDALNGPAEVLASFRAFHKYSAANRQLAASQLRSRGLPISPLGTFKHWQNAGANVLRGSKAISLYMPVTKKETVLKDGEESEKTKSFFIMRNNWFALSQTDKWNDGMADLSAPEGVDWDAERCLKALGISVESFSDMDATVGGYAYKSKDVIAVNPLWGNPIAVLAHELAHKLLHASGSEGAEYTRGAKEVEAEATAFIVSASLGLLSEAEEKGSRHYIRGWADDYIGWDVEEIKSRHARRIFGAVDKILKAGLPAKEASVEGATE